MLGDNDTYADMFLYLQDNFNFSQVCMQFLCHRMYTNMCDYYHGFSNTSQYKKCP